MFSAAKTLSAVDPALWQAIEAERERQDQHIELIASENYTSPAVMQAHGSPANLSGKLFNIVPYGLNDKEEIDYDEMERIALECKPKLLIGGASAYALRFDWARMAEIAKKVGAYFMVDMAHYSGLIAAGV